MGSTRFITQSRGENAQAAFIEAIRRAEFDHGARGYTGTIAEKESFLPVDVPADFEPDMEEPYRSRHYAEIFLNECISKTIDDKYGPAGCITLGPNEWLFFGWAAS